MGHPLLNCNIVGNMTKALCLHLDSKGIHKNCLEPHHDLVTYGVVTHN